MADALTEAMGLVRNATPQEDPWRAVDISGDSDEPAPIDTAIAEILNAVADGRLVRADAAPQWQPIGTAPKAAVDALSNYGPTILLASNSGHRAVGYWRLDNHGWANLHDHLVMNYWNEFTHWMPMPAPPKGDA